MTIVVILTNTILLLCFVVQFIRAKIHERKEAARLAALKPKLKKNKSFLSASFSALRQRFRSSGGEVELTSFENPMLEQGVKNEIKKKKRNSRMKKVRKKLSIGARVRRNSHVGNGGALGGEVKKTNSEVNTAVTIHIDEETGHRYSYDAAADQTQWLEKEDETTITQEGETKTRNKKRPSFRKLVGDDENEVYYENMETGEVVWMLPKDGELVEF